MNADYLEYLLYEARPYLYVCLAAFAFYNYQISKVMFISGTLLLFCSYSVFTMRRAYRAVNNPDQ